MAFAGIDPLLLFPFAGTNPPGPVPVQPGLLSVFRAAALSGRSGKEPRQLNPAFEPILESRGEGLTGGMKNQTETIFRGLQL
jgi:hypothetical protein